MTPAQQPHTRSGGIGQIARAVGWLALLVAGHAGLTAAGTALPAPPAPWQFGDFLQWLEGDDAVRTTFALLRIVGLVTIWYLAGITVLVLVARLSGLRPLARLAHAVAMPWARRLVNNALGAGLALTLAGGVVPVAGATMAAARPVAATAPAPDDHAVTMSLVDDDPDHALTMERLPDEPADPSAQVQQVGRSLARATVSMNRLDDHQPATPATSWTIAPGDHLWHVAASTLRSQWEREPTETEISGYWQQLIDQNRQRLAVPGDPDLVYPGQVFELPPVPAPGP